jgi:two-component system, NarL family, sensor histidine kinase UhpB
MKKIIPLLVFIILFASQKNFSQPQKKIDSLMVKLKTAGQDTSRLSILFLLSWNHMYVSEYPESMKYAEEMKALTEKFIAKASDSKELKYLKEKLGKSYYTIGEVHNSRGDYALALAYCDSAEKIFRVTQSKDDIGRLLYIKGVIHFRQANYKQGLVVLTEAIKVYEELGNKKGLAYVYNIIGNNYNQQANYPEALKNYLSSLKTLEQLKDSGGMGSAYNNLGIVYQRLEKLDEAMKYFTSALDINSRLDDKMEMVMNYYYIGSVYFGRKDYSKALDNLYKSKKLAEEIGDKNNLAFAYLLIGEIVHAQEHYDEALENYFKALKIMEEIDDKYGIENTYSDIAYTYSKKKQYAKSIEYFKKGIHLAKEINDRSSLANIYKGIAQAYEGLQTYSDAYRFHVLHQQINDSIYNETNSKHMEEMKTKYETDKKDAEIALLNKEQEIKDWEIKKQKVLKYAFISGLSALVFLSFIILNNFRVRNKLKLQMLRNKIASDLHDDVGSTLSSIAIFSEVAQQQSKEVIPMLNTISDSARNMLDAMADIVWTINPENDQFEKIILRMRSFAYELLGAKKIDFEFTADENASKLKLPMDVRKNLYLIFKEATNNLVKYSEAKRASFSITRDKNHLTMLIRDNGKGFDAEKESSGNGLKNMKKRAEEIRAKLLIESYAGNGTTIQLIWVYNQARA